MTTNLDALVERLNRTRTVKLGSGSTLHYASEPVNPDGPEAATTLTTLSAKNAKLVETLTRIANWRKESAEYTDRMNLPRRKMDEAQVIHIESEARQALGGSHD